MHRLLSSWDQFCWGYEEGSRWTVMVEVQSTKRNWRPKKSPATACYCITHCQLPHRYSWNEVPHADIIINNNKNTKHNNNNSKNKTKNKQNNNNKTKTKQNKTNKKPAWLSQLRLVQSNPTRNEVFFRFEPIITVCRMCLASFRSNALEDRVGVVPKWIFCEHCQLRSDDKNNNFGVEITWIKS